MDTIKPPHTARTQEVLHRAGMSRQSELTPDEAARLPDAQSALERNEGISRDRLYRILRPRPEDPDA